MATEKVSVGRTYHGTIPIDKQGDALPKSEWPRKRAFSWAVRWFGSNGRRFSKSFKSRREADKYAEERQAAVRAGKGDRPRVIALTEFARMYLDLRGDLASSTKIEQQRTLRFLSDFLGGRRTVNKVTPLDARRFIAWYREREHRGRTPATVNKVLRECKRIFREAVTISLIREDPFCELRQERVGQRSWHYVSPSEYRAMIEASPSVRWRGMITLGYLCGLRLGEVLNLTWQDVDFERSEVCVVRKTASKQRAAWTPKDKDMRIVPLPGMAVNVLTDMHFAVADGQVYMCVNGKGPAAGDRVKRSNVWRDFQALRRKAGIAKCSFHDLRKSYCTNLANAVPLHVVQELAGHADIRTTRKHYLKVHDEQIESARRALNEVMRS